ADPSRQHDPATGLRNVLLVEHLTETHQKIDDLDLASRSGRVTSDDLKRSAGNTEVDVVGDLAGSRALVFGRRLTEQALQHFSVDDKFKLLCSVVRPHVHHVQVALDFHDVVEYQIEIFAF